MGSGGGQKLFLFVNLGFAMYAGSMMVSAIRLFCDPTTYTWLSSPPLQTHYQVLRWYSLVAGIYLAALVCIAMTAVYPRSTTKLNVYLVGLLVLMCSEVGYIGWAVASAMGLYTDQMNNEKFINFDKYGDAFLVQMYIASAAFILSVLLQLTALILCCVLQRKQYSRRDKTDRLSSDRGWKSSNEYRYHHGGQGTTCPRTSKQVTSDMWASAPPELPEYSLHSSSQDILIHN